MRVSSTNRPRHRRKPQATPDNHTNFNEFLVVKLKQMYVLIQRGLRLFTGI